MTVKSAQKLAFDLRETADVLGLSPITIRRLNKRGLLRNVKAVRHLRFSLKEIERFLAVTTEEIPLGKIAHWVGSTASRGSFARCANREYSNASQNRHTANGPRRAVATDQSGQ